MPQTEPRSATYQCLNCRLAQRAEVRRHGRTKLATRGAARADANTSLAMLLALKRCPRCGYFDKGVAEHNRKTVRKLFRTRMTFVPLRSASRRSASV